MKTILLAGGMGTIAVNLARFFKAKDFKVYAIGNCNNFEDFKYRNQFYDQLVNESVTYESLSIFRQKIDFIINCTGSGTVGFSNKNPVISFKKSTESTNAILEFTRVFQKDAVNIFLSSGAVYGNSISKCEEETYDLSPISTYGLHKKINENIYKSFSKMYDLKVFTLRLFSIYGKGFKKQLLWDACKKINNSNESKIEFWGTGYEERDWLNINDLCLLIYKLMLNEGLLFEKSKYQIYNCGTGITSSVKYILNQIKLYFKYDGEIVFNNIAPKGDPKYLKANILKLSKLNWFPLLDIDNGLIDYCNWFEEFYDEK